MNNSKYICTEIQSLNQIHWIMSS